MFSTSNINGRILPLKTISRSPKTSYPVSTYPPTYLPTQHRPNSVSPFPSISTAQDPNQIRSAHAPILSNPPSVSPSPIFPRLPYTIPAFSLCKILNEKFYKPPSTSPTASPYLTFLININTNINCSRQHQTSLLVPHPYHSTPIPSALEPTTTTATSTSRAELRAMPYRAGPPRQAPSSVLTASML